VIAEYAAAQHVERSQHEYSRKLPMRSLQCFSWVAVPGIGSNKGSLESRIRPRWHRRRQIRGIRHRPAEPHPMPSRLWCRTISTGCPPTPSSAYETPVSPPGFLRSWLSGVSAGPAASQPERKPNGTSSDTGEQARLPHTARFRVPLPCPLGRQRRCGLRQQGDAPHLGSGPYGLPTPPVGPRQFS
jgi:hypothetical protein